MPPPSCMMKFGMASAATEAGAAYTSSCMHLQESSGQLCWDVCMCTQVGLYMDLQSNQIFNFFVCGPPLTSMYIYIQ